MTEYKIPDEPATPEELHAAWVRLSHNVNLVGKEQEMHERRVKQAKEEWLAGRMSLTDYTAIYNGYDCGTGKPVDGSQRAARLNGEHIRFGTYYE